MRSQTNICFGDVEVFSLEHSYAVVCYLPGQREFLTLRDGCSFLLKSTASHSFPMLHIFLQNLDKPGPSPVTQTDKHHNINLQIYEISSLKTATVTEIGSYVLKLILTLFDIWKLINISCHFH